MAITIVAVGAAVLLITKFARTAGAYGEVSTLEEQRASADTLLRSDFDGAGYNLTRPSMPTAGKEAVQFLPSPDFNTTTPGSLSKLNENDTYAYSSKAVTSGVGLWTWTPRSTCLHCWTYVVGNDGSFVAFFVYSAGNSVSPTAIYESSVSGRYVANSYCQPPLACLPNHEFGDTYQIGVEAPNAQQTNRFIRYYRIRNGIRTILYTSNLPVPPYPLYMLSYQKGTGSAINNVSVIGAPLTDRTNNVTEFAHLPFDGGTQLTSPITITGGGNTAIILSGDKTTDAAAALTAFSSASTQIDLKTPARGSYAAGDAVLLVDYGNADPSNPISPASAVCLVTAASNVDSQTTRLTLTRARQANPVWGRLWSSDTDHAHTFPASETSVIKLAPPVTYVLSTDSRLVRVEGARVSTVAFNVRQLNFAQASGNTFTASAVIAAEGVETANDSSNETRSTIQFASTPRAMNLASNQQN
jgi:hypothetical protein